MRREGGKTRKCKVMRSGMIDSAIREIRDLEMRQDDYLE